MEELKSKVIEKLSQFFNVPAGSLSKFNFDGTDDITLLSEALNGTNHEGVSALVTIAISATKRDLGIIDVVSDEVKLVENKVQLFTKLGNSYWDDNGVYQEEFNRLSESTPDSGSSTTLHGELIRAINRLYYEFCNNGNCNAQYHERPFNWGDEEDDDANDIIDIDDYYEKFLDLIDKTVEKNLTRGIRNLILQEGRYDFHDHEMAAYDKVVDRIVYFVLTTEDKPLPQWYEID